MSDVWYYAQGERTVGPVTLAELTAVLSRVTFANYVLIWREGSPDWVKAENVPELSALFIDTKPIPPPLPSRVDRAPETDASSIPQEHPHRPRKRRTWRVVIMVLFLFWLFGGGILALKLLGFDTDLQPGVLPKCSSQTASDLLKKAIEGSALSKVVTVSVFEIQNQRELSNDSSVKRWCSASVLMNSGKHEIGYTVEWTDNTKSKIWLQTTAW